MARDFGQFPNSASIRASAPEVLYPDPIPQSVYEIPKRMTEAEEDSYRTDLVATLEARGFNPLEKQQALAFYRDYRASANEFHLLRDELGKKAQSGYTLSEAYNSMGEVARSQGMRIKLTSKPNSEEVERLRTKIHEHQLMKGAPLVASTWRFPQFGRWPNGTKFISPALWWVSVGLKTYLLFPVAVLVLGTAPRLPVDWLVLLTLSFVMSLGFTFAIRIGLVTLLGSGRNGQEKTMKLPGEILTKKVATAMAITLLSCVLVGLIGVMAVDVPASAAIRGLAGGDAQQGFGFWVEFLKILLLMSLFVGATLAYEFSRMIVELAAQAGPDEEEFAQVDGPYREAKSIIELNGDLARRRSDALWKESRWEKFEADLNAVGKSDTDVLVRKDRARVLSVLRGHLTKFSNKGW